MKIIYSNCKGLTIILDTGIDLEEYDTFYISMKPVSGGSVVTKSAYRVADSNSQIGFTTSGSDLEEGVYQFQGCLKTSGGNRIYTNKVSVRVEEALDDTIT